MATNRYEVTAAACETSPPLPFFIGHAFVIEIAPHSRDFDALAFILKFVGGCTLATSLLFVMAGAQLTWIAVATGAFFVASGYGLSSYKTWAWYATAVVMPIFAVVFSLLSVIEMGSNMVGF